ncbi:dihydrolipoamide acetyltransferase family protein [Marinobacter sp. AN1]|uniref:dihydrolipoamide acetyltransferase family protein n=1 Tax=Marinobacter sp. AN1 TaxID=2886046 RepID=UPI00222E691B|nr:dihydrolipoamide acetyltransferase family protein [Marinobacter sp. AN1]UZD64606.1 2-oxo acid dehydrogenase subunit E2 [Marinobacter sp. AN1]
MSEFTMPSLGADMDVGKLVQWKVKVGDRVTRGQVIAAVETSKAVLDVEVFEDGVVEALYVGEGTEVDVGTPLARIGDGSGKGRPGPETPSPGTTKPATEPGETIGAHARPEKASKEDRPLPSQPVSAGSVPADNGGHAAERILASPAARRRAREAGVDLSGIRGSGPDRAVVLRDLQGTTPGRRPAPAGGGFDREQMRATIAAAMTRSKREIPHYYLATMVDLHAAEAWLADYNQHQPPEKRLLLAALFMKATAMALARYPELNGHYGEAGFAAADQVNLGMAVHLRGGGLVAPAISDTDKLSLPELMQRFQDLVRRARGGGLRLSEITGGTATLTALGDRGVDTVYGVIYPPQVAMIGIGRARRRPLAVGDGVAVRLAVDLTLAADHRVCDGHLGALFLNEIEQRLQQPEAL